MEEQSDAGYAVFEVARISTVDVAGSDRYYYAVSKRLAAGILLDYCIAGG
jgi:hypothetical protein